jgi:hypothetical protein
LGTVKHATIVFWRRRLLDDRRQESKFQMGAPEAWMIYPAARTAYARRDGVGTVYTSGPVALLGMNVVLDVEEVFRALDED